MSDALSAVESIYFTIQTNLNMMLAVCHTQADHDAVMTKYVAARQNYWSCINKSFHDDDPAVKALVGQAKQDVVVLQGIEKQLGDISKVLDALTRGVTIGSAIVAKVITL